MVVAAFQGEDQAPRAQLIREGLEGVCDSGKASYSEAKLGEGVSPVTVVASRNEDKLGRIATGKGEEDFLADLLIGSVICTCREWDIHRVSLARAFAGLGAVPRAGVEGVEVGGEVQDLRGGVERFLRAVAMMGVEVYD